MRVIIVRFPHVRDNDVWRMGQKLKWRRISQTARADETIKRDVGSMDRRLEDEAMGNK